MDTCILNCYCHLVLDRFYAVRVEEAFWARSPWKLQGRGPVLLAIRVPVGRMGLWGPEYVLPLMVAPRYPRRLLEVREASFPHHQIALGCSLPLLVDVRPFPVWSVDPSLLLTPRQHCLLFFV